MFKNNLSIKNALGLFAAVVAVLFMVIGLTAYLTVDRLSNTLNEAADNTGLLRASSDAAMLHNAIHGDSLGLVLAYERGETDWINKLEKQFEDHKTHLTKSVAAMASNKASPNIRKAIDEVKPAIDSYIIESTELSALTKTDMVSALFRINELEAKFTTISSRLSALSDQLESENRNFLSDTPTLQ